MGVLTFAPFLSLVSQELQGMVKPAGTPRRVGVMDYLDEQLSGIRLSISELLDTAEEDGEEKTLEYLDDYLIDLMSLLYAAGAPHEVWRRWSSLVSFEQGLAHRHYSAAVYAALGGEWAFIEQMPATPTESTDFEKKIIWHLLGKSDSVPALDIKGDPLARAWLRLAQSIPRSDHKQTESSIKAIADFWLEELGDTWDHYEPDAYPTFHPPACAAAAIARRRGYTPQKLSSNQYRFLEPGLDASQPRPLRS
jgi:hypothetical protein